VVFDQFNKFKKKGVRYMLSQQRWLFPVPVIVLLLAINLAACGGGGGGGSSSTASSTTPTQTPTPSPTPVPSSGWGSPTQLGTLRDTFYTDIYAQA
jgi:hypothetical protein